MALSNLITAMRRTAFTPRLKVAARADTVRLGTEYGSWHFIDAPNLRGATIVSCGLGEDASFDVAFAARYGAKVVIVDPTPRAIAHFNAIKANIGQPARRDFLPGGQQPVEAYDLSALTENSLTLVERALWSEEKTLRFYAPKEAAHVSYSATNYFNGFSTATPYIEVQSITLDTLIRQLGVYFIPLLKLDAAGAEGAIIQDMLAKNIRPDQVLIDYDQITAYSRKSKTGIEFTDFLLRRSGYRLVHFKHPSNFLYVR